MKKNSKNRGDFMQFLFNKMTLFIIGFLSLCLIVIGFLLQTILIPIQDLDYLSKHELLELQKQYSLNYPLGTGLLYLGTFLLILVIILFIIKLKNIKNKI